MKALLVLLFSVCFSAHAGIDDSYQRFMDKNASAISSQQTLDAIKAEVSTQFKNSGASDVSWFGLDRAMDSHGEEMIANAIAALNNDCQSNKHDYCIDIESIHASILLESSGLRP